MALQRWLHTRFDLGTFKKTDPFGTIRLMTRGELNRLFPGAAIVPERVGPLVKSWYVFGGEGMAAATDRDAENRV